MASAAVCVQGLRAPPLLSSSGIALRGEPLMSAGSALTTRAAPSTLRIRAESVGSGGGTKSVRKVSQRHSSIHSSLSLSGTRECQKWKHSRSFDSICPHFGPPMCKAARCRMSNVCLCLLVCQWTWVLVLQL